ncbi:MAG: rhomboid family intramembrane serine protease [Deltaproteobacteria bacterium]|nr:MAG: rhomboid family intramembrane serine protease [Deltaproteobacteria bacterium]
MFFDLLLISAIVATAYLGPMLLRRGSGGQRLYGWLLVANLVLAVVALAARNSDADRAVANLVGFVAIAASVFLIMVPPMVRGATHWAYRTDRLRLARHLAALRELLQPGMGGAQEAELFQSMLDVRSGRVDEAVEALRRRRAEIDDPLVRRRIDERIVVTYLYARRWQDAIAAFEAIGGVDGGPLSPATVAEMVGAYCEAGRIETAAELVDRLEQSPLSREPLFAPLLYRARLVFLAFVGRTAAVDAIVAPDGVLGPTLPDAVRHYWAGVARLRAGDRPGAIARFDEAVRRAGRNRRVRELAASRLESVDAPGIAGPHAFPAAVAELADRLAERAVMPSDGERAARLAATAPRRAPLVTGIIVANLAVMAVLWAVYGATDSIAALVRTANLRAGVDAGQWWRIPTSVFVHVGLPHLLLNMYGLWALGRFVEHMFGSVRTAAIYAVAGVAGAAASYLVSGAALSAGASGAVLGLAGALLAELGLRRDAYPKRWRSGLFRLLLLLTGANVAIGFAYPAIDQAAHLGGLAAGAVMAAWLSPRWGVGRARITAVAAAAIAGLVAAATLYGAVAAATTSYADLLAAQPPRPRAFPGVVVDAPAPWRLAGGELADDSGLYIRFEVRAVSSLVDADEAVDAVVARERRDALALRGFDAVREARSTPLRLPAPWRGRHIEAVARGPSADEVYRVVAFAREAPGGGVWAGSAYLPDALADDLSPVIASMLASARPAP